MDFRQRHRYTERSGFTPQFWPFCATSHSQTAPSEAMRNFRQAPHGVPRSFLAFSG
jgi:hypothetical protein